MQKRFYKWCFSFVQFEDQEVVADFDCQQDLSGVSFVWWLTATRAPVCILPIVHFVRA